MIRIWWSKIWLRIQRRNFWFDLCSNMMFFWWFRFDLMIFWISSTNVSSKMIKRIWINVEKKNLLNRNYRDKFVCFKNQTTQTNEFIMFRFCLYSQRIHYWFCFDIFFEWSKRYESIMFHYHLNFMMTKCFVYLMFAYFKRTWREWFRYNVKCYAMIWYYYIITRKYRNEKQLHENLTEHM